jgi:hypothetical protein
MRRWVRRGLPLVAGIVLGVAGIVLGVAVTTLGSIAASSPGPATQPQSLIVSTGAGQIEGRTTGTVDQFLGVRYAAPPSTSARSGTAPERGTKASGGAGRRGLAAGASGGWRCGPGSWIPGRAFPAAASTP